MSQSSLLLPPGQPPAPPPPEEPPDMPALQAELAEAVRDYFRARRDPAAAPLLAAIARMRTAIIALHKAEHPA